MVRTINMQDMRYLNLFGKITRVNTRFCFRYNETIVFCIPKERISKAVGKRGSNVKKLNEILGRKIRIIASPRGIEDVKSFIEDIVKPVVFKDLEIKDNEIILAAGNQSKAALIGRNKRRFLEMQKIVSDFFGKEFRII
jgi:N utilization substance protein A